MNDIHVVFRGHLTMCGDTLVATTGGGGNPIGIYWVEARHATEHLMIHRESPTTKNYQVQNVNSAEIVKF